MQLYCCACASEVSGRLTDGVEIYPHREDLASLPFWRCDACGNYVGCHHKTKDRTQPLGCIPTPELLDARKKLHQLIDPIWRSGRMGRRQLYKAISKDLGWEFHAAELRTMVDARLVHVAATKYAAHDRSGPAYAPSERQRSAAQPGPVVITRRQRPAAAGNTQPELAPNSPEARHMRAIALET